MHEHSKGAQGGWPDSTAGQMHRVSVEQLAGVFIDNLKLA